MSESKTIQVTATPEVLAEMAVRPVKREDGALEGVTLHWPSGTYAGMVGRLPVEDPGASNPLAYVRAWLVGHITAAYETGKADGEKASKDDLGWHAAMGHVAQILGVDDSGDPKAIEERIRAEVSRLKDSADAFAAGANTSGLRARIIDLTAEVEGVRANMAKELAKALQMTHLVPWDGLLEEARDLVAADVDGLREKIKDLTDDVARAHDTGLRKGWVAAISAANASCQEKWNKRVAAEEAAALAKDEVERATVAHHAACEVREAMQEAAIKGGES